MKCETCEHCGGISWAGSVPRVDCKSPYMTSLETIDAVVGCMWYKAMRDKDGCLIDARQGNLFGGGE